MINLKVLFTSSKYVSVEALKGSRGAKVSSCNQTRWNSNEIPTEYNTFHSRPPQLSHLLFMLSFAN